MSYCRWSSDDFGCDVYVYAHIDRWATRVASSRYAFTEPLPAALTLTADNMPAWMERHRKVSEIIDRAPTEPIGLPYDGRTFEDDSPGECADTVAMLLAVGYRAPCEVISDLREEQAELDGADEEVHP